MPSGRVTKVVASFTPGSESWGKIQRDGDSRLVFFNLASLNQPGDFARLEADVAVQFEEEIGMVKGIRAVRLEIVEPMRLPGPPSLRL